MIDADLAVLPGCVLSQPTFRKYYDTLKNIKENGIPIVILGGSGELYSKKEVDFVKKLLERLDINLLITRDEVAYDIYSNDINQVYNGIDCSLFLNDWYTPEDSIDDYIIHTFDKIAEPRSDDREKIIRPNHAPFDEPYHFKVLEKLKEFVGIDPGIFGKKNTFISDLIEDYLFLYANCLETHSDRVHACLPTLIYGNQTRFYYETERANLFDRLPLDGNVNKELVSLDMDKIEERKSNQVKYFKQGVEQVI